ncbi:hypothetical protein LZF95_09565 [Algoriphagus sp. AGSA1]|uniref:hypothetical protein n=1 Tax=Algoriphagus sp. AGSA1 TaxID=2907213 RepID=UPI001F2BC97C|nr:hypothetical protein [Algoriphagus sp. AGSA1]MCE7054919.1 hypothetical protein [Algoriphagus sp. AGSA1]
MKKKLVVLLMLLANSSIAQELDGEKVSGFFHLPVENLLGILDFNMEEVAKRLHLKSQSSEYKKMDRIISWYQVKTDSIYTANKPQLVAIENSYWAKVAAIDDRNDFDRVFAVVKEYTDAVKPYSPPIQALELEVGNWISTFLSERQYDKWEKYLAKKHKKNKPKTPMPMSGPPIGDL